MTGYFSLWDIGSGNIINTFDDVDDALRIAAILIEDLGAAYADDLELSWSSHDDQVHQQIAIGPSLIAMTEGHGSRRKKQIPPTLAMIRSRRTVSRVYVRQPVAS